MAADEHLGAVPAPPAKAPEPAAITVAAVDTSIPLPPLPAGLPGTANNLSLPAGDQSLMDCALVVILLTLAFLLASFPARNSDLFLHLGAGKLLAQGKYTFGTDPFASTTAGAYWVNTSWGFDLLSYGIYSLFPENGLVALKALFVALTAGALVFAGRSGRGWLVPVACAGLAVLALAAYVPFSSVCVSYLFLALLLWLLERTVGEVSVAAVRCWPVPVLFAVWVNFDGWFVLGLVVLALYAVGAVLRSLVAASSQRLAGARGAGLALLVILAVSVTACLLNPHHYHVFTILPADLGLSGSYDVLKQDDTFRALVTSPFEAGYFRPQSGLNATGLTYFALIALGLFALVLNARGLRWAHVLTWLVLLALSAYQARLIPFFAIASAPILALNFQAWYTRQVGAGAPSAHLDRWAFGGRGLTLLVGAALLVLSWPGWLQSTPYDVRRWNVEGDPGLALAAGQLRQWHEKGVFTDQTPGFVFSVETAQQLAWLCPEERGFIDSRWPLFDRDTAADYLAVRQALLGKNPAADNPKAAAWRDVLRKHHIHHLVLPQIEAVRTRPVLFQLARMGDEWPLLYLENGTAVFGWNDPTAGRLDPFAALRLDLDRQAFFPAEDKKAPRVWAGREPKPAGWYDLVAKPRPPRAADREDAALFLDYFDSRRNPTEAMHATEWDASLAAAVFGFTQAGDGPTAIADLTLRASQAAAVRHTFNEPWGPRVVTPVEEFALKLRIGYLLGRDSGPPSAAFLAVRAGRRAIHANPDDARAYLLLGEAYVRLNSYTSERAAYGGSLGGLWQLERIRRAQAVSALYQALILQPDLTQAHNRLASIFRAMGYGDLQLKHLRDEYNSLKAAGPTAGEAADKFAGRLETLQKQIDDQAAVVKKNLDQFEVNSANRKVLDRAKLAAGNGLPGKALEILEASDVSAFGAEGMSLELELFLFTGRVSEVREWLEPAHEDVLGPERYGLIRLLLFAATGDYAAADGELAKMAATAAQTEPDDPYSPLRSDIATLVAQAVIDGPVENRTPLGVYYRGDDIRRKRIQTIMQLVQGLRQQAELSVVRAMLAVERGDGDRAGELLHEYVDGLYASAEAAESGAGLDFFGRPLGQRYLLLLRPNSGR